MPHISRPQNCILPQATPNIAIWQLLDVPCNLTVGSQASFSRSIESCGSPSQTTPKYSIYSAILVLMTHFSRPQYCVFQGPRYRAYQVRWQLPTSQCILIPDSRLLDIMRAVSSRALWIPAAPHYEPFSFKSAMSTLMSHLPRPQYSISP